MVIACLMRGKPIPKKARVCVLCISREWELSCWCCGEIYIVVEEREKAYSRRTRVKGSAARQSIASSSESSMGSYVMLKFSQGEYKICKIWNEN